MSSFSLPSSVPVLDGLDVHVWFATLDPHPELLAELTALLSPDEKERAASYRYDTDRTRFVARRGLLRVLLGAYLARELQTLQFAYNAYGKPSLRDASGLAFNLSHSAGLACYALTRAGEVGVDIERVRDDFSPEECIRLAESAFSPAELRDLRARPREQWRSTFFTGWTRKEAYIKARGMGLSLPLARYSVSLDPDRTDVVREAAPQANQEVSFPDAGSRERATEWYCAPITLPRNDATDADYVAALAVAGPPHSRRVLCRWMM